MGDGDFNFPLALLKGAGQTGVIRGDILSKDMFCGAIREGGSKEGENVRAGGTRSSPPLRVSLELSLRRAKKADFT